MLRGPASFSVNDECGLLVDGFEFPADAHDAAQPALLRGPGGAGRLRQGEGPAGLPGRRREDVYVPVPERLARGTELIRQRLGITIRPLDLERLRRGGRARSRQIYNAAWEKNWGFVPMTEHEIDHLAEQFRPVVDPGLRADRREGRQGDRVRHRAARTSTRSSGRTARGACLPVLPRLLWALKMKKIRRARILLLGVVPEYRGKAVDAMLYHWIWTKAERAGHPLGRGGLDPGGQPGHERRAREDDLPGLQDLPALRPADMKALVTGATGFVGSHLAEALRAPGRRGHRAGPLAAARRRRSSRWACAWSRAISTTPARSPAPPRDRTSSSTSPGVVAARNETEFMRCNRDGTASLVAAAARPAGGAALRPRVVDGRGGPADAGTAAHRQPSPPAR